MKEKIGKIGAKIKEKWSALSKMLKVLIITVPIAVVVIIVALCVILNHKDDAVLMTGLSTADQGEVTSIITGLGVTDVRVTSSGDVIVPEDQVDYLRMQLAMQGYPKDAANYEIWKNGVDLWSTDVDKREVQRQQRETRIAATLVTLDAIQSCTATLDIPEKKDYVIVEDAGEPTCSIVIKLRDGYELTNAEVRAIYRMVTTSVDGLINDNVSVMDTLGRSYQWISEEEEKNGIKDASGVLVAQRRLLFQKEMQQVIYDGVYDMLLPVYGEGNFAINVSAVLNYDIMTQEKNEYFPMEGSDTGVTNHEQHIKEGAALDADKGLVGVTPNADASPDYPTYIGLEDGQSYYYDKDEVQYDVTNIKTSIIKDGYSIEKLSVGLMLNVTDMTEAEREAMRSVVANAAGTDPSNVSVYNTAFALKNSNGTTIGSDPFGTIIHTQEPDSFRDLLLFVVIALGALLILLLILTLFMSKSRKKKIHRRQQQAFAAAAAGAEGAGGSAQQPEEPEEVDFNIASLTEEAGKDSRETILKREIAEFSKSSPEIVAQIIKNMLREEQ